MRRLIYIFSFLFVVYSSTAQNSTIYNINSDNGLSTNHVYGTLVDTLGYLWIGTADGVYRYNGYTLRKYDYNDGLPNTDVWMLYEDHKGRIWLSSIAQSIGYIKNNIYTPVIKKYDSLMLQVYPNEQQSYGDTIIFYNRIYNDDFTHTFGVIYNDTLYEKRLSNVLNNDLTEEERNRESYYITKDYIISTSDDSVKFFEKGAIYAFDNILPGKLVRSYKPCIPLHSVTVNYVGVKSYADKYITLYSRYDREMQYFDFLNNRTGSISFENEIISHVFYRNNFLYIITDKGVHVYNSDMEEVEWYSYDYMKKNNPNFDAVNTFYYTNDDFWGHCISTSNAGLFTLFEENLNNLLASSNLAGYDFVGYKNDSTGYWWKVEDRSLVEVCKGVIASKRILPKHLSDINLIIHGNDNKPLLLNKFCVYNINADNTLSSVTKPYDSIVRYTSNYEVVNTLNRNVSYFDIFFRAISDILPLGTNKFLYLGTSVIGAIDVTFVDSIKTIFTHNLDIERYEHALLDSVTNNVICYATDKIMLLTDSQKRTLYQKEINALFGINDIESIAIDKYGHIFIKSAYKMLLANRDHATVRSIMNSYNMSGSKVHVTGDILTAVGTFGVVQYKIHPSGTISEIGNFPNVKNTKYNKVFDVQFSKNHVIFKTDNGVYTVNTSTGKKLSEKPNYRVVLNLNDQLLQIKAGDTISIDQETNSIGVDIIKPTGTGELKINYKFVDSSYTNTGYNIIIPDLSPNNYYDVTIVATDATWQSSPIHFQVYVTPYWWQTNTAIRIFFMLGILLLIGFVYIIIIMTRRIVNRNNERRNQQRELELKSIYSQINPHFIFNTLSTAQYFVKKNKNKEAYNHISQFSDLLRSYIKSSRNKYITIAEETENLKNYLELQLSRFENMFTYEIEVGDNISPLSVQIPSLLLQPIVENALNHGIFHKEEAGHLSIKFEIDENDDLQCIVDDNGVGRNKAKEIGHERMKKATSYGTILINELVDTFNKYEKINISLKYIDKKFPETGTTVIITIKNLRDAK